jgi:protein-tyrosine phosphatase
MKILMVCLGNICRSPLAEGILRTKAAAAGLKWTIDSAGTRHYCTGHPPHKLSQRIAAANGVTIDQHSCRQFVQGDMEAFDKIYVMDDYNYEEVKRIAGKSWDSNKVDYLMNESFPFENRSIPDPYHGVESDYEHVYSMIALACDDVVLRYSQPAAS